MPGFRGGAGYALIVIRDTRPRSTEKLSWLGPLN
jgi:hypothetical protein